MKKGAIILLVSSLAFLISTLLFVDLDLKKEDAGLLQLEILQAAKSAESARLFLLQSAKLALEQTLPGGSSSYNTCKKNPRSPECQNILDREFPLHFSRYLDLFNTQYQQRLRVEDFSFELNPEGSVITEKKKFIVIKAASAQPLVFKGSHFQHARSPDFFLRYELQ